MDELMISRPNAFRAVLACSLLAFAGCAETTTSAVAPDTAETKTNAAAMDKAEDTVSTATASTKAPPMRWDHRPGSEGWTVTAQGALRSHGAVLPSVVPNDIDTWCPGYKTASLEDREAFWVGLISTLAKHESTWNPAAVGGGGRWFGLVQISPSTAQLYGCKAKSGAALKNGGDNVSCAIRIMSRTVPRDGVVSEGMRGVAADWGPFHSSKKRSDMIAWTSAQPFCQPPKRSKVLDLLKPVHKDEI